MRSPRIACITASALPLCMRSPLEKDVLALDVVLPNGDAPRGIFLFEVIIWDGKCSHVGSRY